MSGTSETCGVTHDSLAARREDKISNALLKGRDARVENFAGQIFALRDSLIITDMWKIQKGELYEFEDLGVGMILRVSQWVEPTAKDSMVLDGNPVPVRARYTVDVFVEGKIERLEVHVYFEWTGDVLHRSWNCVGGFLDRKGVKLLAK